MVSTHGGAIRPRNGIKNCPLLLYERLSIFYPPKVFPPLEGGPASNIQNPGSSIQYPASEILDAEEGCLRITIMIMITITITITIWDIDRECYLR